MADKLADMHAQFPMEGVTIEQAQERLLELLPRARDLRIELKKRETVARKMMEQANAVRDQYRDACGELDQLTLFLRSGEADYPAGRDGR